MSYIQTNDKASLIHEHGIQDVKGLQISLENKVQSNIFADTVSVLQRNIDTKAPIGHTHQISEVQGLLEKLSFQWTRKNTNGELIYKTLVDTSAGDISLSVPANVNFNAEFEIKKIFRENYCRISGINKINGYSLNTRDILFFDDSNTQASTTKLIYIDDVVGWISFPSTAFNTLKSLSLPTNKLRQLFYAGEFASFEENSLISLWSDSRSGLNATQSNNANKPIVKKNIFGNNTIPSVFFPSSACLNIDFSWILNKKFTICIVERRASGSGALIHSNASTDSLVVSYSPQENIFYKK